MRTVAPFEAPNLIGMKEMGKVVQGDFSRRQAKHDGAAQESPVPVYTFRLAVSFSEPLIWRDVRVSGEMTLDRFHRTIQACMGWKDCDTHQFLVGKIFYQPGFGIDGTEKKVEFDEARYKLHELEEGMGFLFTYLYDGGEGWELEIGLEEVDRSGSVLAHPLVIDGERGGPPEEIGDIHQYQALVFECEQELEPGARVALPGYLGFDPEAFDPDKINEILKEI